MVALTEPDIQSINGTANANSLAMLDPSAIQVDSETYQFRRNGDKNGVTRAGRYNTDEWIPVLHSDPLLVHQRLDGSLFVADGHHRLDLAKRSNAQGKGPGKVAALILREADGYSAKDVRVIAAYKNMAHGHSDPIDAARVFKEAYSGQVHTELLPNLQMDKSNLRLSYRLSKLSDTALNRVATDNIPLEMAAAVAEKTPDPVKQEKVIKIISYKLRQAYNGGHPLQNDTVTHASRLSRNEPVSSYIQMLEMQKLQKPQSYLSN